jgi:hypothetical protein
MTYAHPAWEFVAEFACETRFSAPLEIFQGAHRPAICTSLSTFHMYDYVTKLCRQQAELLHNHENEHMFDKGDAYSFEGNPSYHERGY